MSINNYLRATDEGLRLILSDKMKVGEIVHRTSKGCASLEWQEDNGNQMFLIHFEDGRKLYTNSIYIVREELNEPKKPKQLTLELE